MTRNELPMPDVKLPLWTVIDETKLWDVGLMRAVVFVQNPHAEGPHFPLCYKRGDAELLVRKLGATTARPLPLPTSMFIAGMVTSFITDTAVKNAALFTPGRLESNWWVCELQFVLERLGMISMEEMDRRGG